MRRHLTLLLIIVLLGSLAVATDAGASFALAAPSIPQLPADHGHADPEEEFEEGGEIEGEDCEGEEFEFEEEEFEEAEEEFEAEECGEGEAAKAGGSFVSGPAACLIRHAESAIATLPGSGSVRLTVRYKTWGPTAVDVGLKLTDHKGSLTLGRATKHLGAQGVLHITTKLGAAAMERAERAHEFDVSLRAPGTPSFCGGLLEQSLHVAGGARRAGASRVHGTKRG